jgi:hypothetical protein
MLLLFGGRQEACRALPREHALIDVESGPAGVGR